MKRVLISIFIIMFSLNVFSQESSIYIGYKSMREINASYDYSLGYNKKVGATVGLIFATDSERAYGNVFPEGSIDAALTRKQNQQGISLSAFLKFVKGRRGRLLLALSLEYQYLKSGNYTCHIEGYSGSYQSINGGEYSEFKHIYNNFAFLLGIHHEFLKDNIVGIYFECGVAFKSIERFYSIEGYYDNRWPSNKIELLGNLTPTFRIGMNFRILSFGEKIEDPMIKKGRKVPKTADSPNVKML